MDCGQGYRGDASPQAAAIAVSGTSEQYTRAAILRKPQRSRFALPPTDRPTIAGGVEFSPMVLGKPSDTPLNEAPDVEPIHAAGP